jgi:drug/metabolite transporter (DMT)-like permease
VGLLLFYSIPSVMQQQWLKHQAARQQAATSAPANAVLVPVQKQQQQQLQPQIQVQLSSKDGAAGYTVSAADEHAQQPQQQQQQRQQQQRQKQQELLQRVRSATKAAALSVLIGTLLNVSAVASAGAAKLVNAYVVQLLLLLTPLVCALCNTLILRQPSPPKLLLAVLLSLAGGGMVVGGYWLQEQQQAAGSKAAKAVEAKSLVLGVVVALLAMLGQALYFVMVQLTRKSLSAQQVGAAGRQFVQFVQHACLAASRFCIWQLATAS